MPVELSDVVHFMADCAHNLELPDHLEVVTKALEAFANVHVTQSVISNRCGGGQS